MLAGVTPSVVQIRPDDVNPDVIGSQVISALRQMESELSRGLEAFYRRGTKAGIQAHHAAKLRLMLTALDYAKRPEDMNAPGWRFHALIGDMKGFYSVTVNANWRVIFRFDGKDAELVNYLDYH